MGAVPDFQRLYDLIRGCSPPRYAGEADALSREVTAFLLTVSDANIRHSLYERYINCRSWDAIADMFCCGSADTVRKRCKRYIDKCT